MRKTYTWCSAFRNQSKLCLYACRLAQFPRTTKEIADMFGIQSKDISRTTQIFQDAIMGITEKNYVTKALDVMNRLSKFF